VTPSQIRYEADKVLLHKAKEVRMDTTKPFRMRLAALLVEITFWTRVKLKLNSDPPKWLKFKIWKSCGPNWYYYETPTDDLNHACIEHDIRYHVARVRESKKKEK